MRVRLVQMPSMRELYSCKSLHILLVVAISGIEICVVEIKLGALHQSSEYVSAVVLGYGGEPGSAAPAIDFAPQRVAFFV
jgi:hypothetical protein